MNARLTFGGLLKSEWIKLWTVRATWWCFAIAVAVTVLIALLVSSFSTTPENQADLTSTVVNSQLLQFETVGLRFSQLVVVVLGALVITGEYGTGMIRSTFMASPGRIGAVIAKALVFGLTTFVLGLVSLGISLAITLPIYSSKGVSADLSDGAFWAAIVGAAGFLALIGTFSTALGLLLRNSAATIATALGLVLVLPIIVSLIGRLINADWLTNASLFLPGEAGARMYAIDVPSVDGSAPFALTPWEGGLVLAAWLVIVGVIGLVAVKRRDV